MKAVRETSLHVFCDYSQDAYGACAYLRRAFEDTQTICRLELMEALLAARLAETLATELTMKIREDNLLE